MMTPSPLVAFVFWSLSLAGDSTRVAARDTGAGSRASALAAASGAADSTRSAGVSIADSAGRTRSTMQRAGADGVAGAPAAFAADSIVVEKSARRLTLFHRGAAARSYLVALGRNPVGPKERRGDGRTPEGLFTIDARNPESRFHLALHVSYPDSAARARARALGESPGGDVMIHGLPNGQGDVGEAHREEDWTEGCVAVTDEEIEEIWRLVPTGTPIRIRP